MAWLREASKSPYRRCQRSPLNRKVLHTIWPNEQGASVLHRLNVQTSPQNRYEFHPETLEILFGLRKIVHHMYKKLDLRLLQSKTTSLYCLETLNPIAPSGRGFLYYMRCTKCFGCFGRTCVVHASHVTETCSSFDVHFDVVLPRCD